MKNPQLCKRLIPDTVCVAIPGGAETSQKIYYVRGGTETPAGAVIKRVLLSESPTAKSTRLRFRPKAEKKKRRDRFPWLGNSYLLGRNASQMQNSVRREIRGRSQYPEMRINLRGPRKVYLVPKKVRPGYDSWGGVWEERYQKEKKLPKKTSPGAHRVPPRT